MTNTYINASNLSEMYKALYLSPMIPSFNLRETANFFKEALQFEVARDDEHYIIMYKGHCTIHLLRAGNSIGEMEFYFEVNDIDEVWNLMKNKVEGLKVREPFDRDYGMREIHIAIPATKTILFIGQEIKK